jgi:uncharacterized protein YciI
MQILLSLDISEVTQMLFMVAGYLQPGAEERLIDLRDEFNEHLAQSPLVAGGVLRDPEGHRKGYLGFLEAEDIESAMRYLNESPFSKDGLYERMEVFRYDLEVGAIK